MLNKFWPNSRSNQLAVQQIYQQHKELWIFTIPKCNILATLRFGRTKVWNSLLRPAQGFRVVGKVHGVPWAVYHNLSHPPTPTHPATQREIEVLRRHRNRRGRFSGWSSSFSTSLMLQFVLLAGIGGWRGGENLGDVRGSR